MYLANLDPQGVADNRTLRDQRSLSDKFIFVVQSASVGFVAESCIHVLKRANHLLGQNIYSWKLVDASASCSFASLSCCPDEVLVLVGGVDHPWRPTTDELPTLRAAIRSAARVCVIGGAAFVPLVSGVLGSKQIAAHATFHAGIRETCSNVDLHADATCHHKALSSSTGPAAAMRMMVELVGAREGEFTQSALGRDLGLQQTEKDPQQGATSGTISGERWRLQRRAQGCDVISEALQIMDDHLEDTLSVAQIAEIIGVSARKLERCFSEKLNRSPLKVYRDLRLDRAHDLMTQTVLPLSEVTLACGFSNVTLMKRWFFRKYGRIPCDVRRQAFQGVHAT